MIWSVSDFSVCGWLLCLQQTIPIDAARKISEELIWYFHTKNAAVLQTTLFSWYILYRNCCISIQNSPKIGLKGSLCNKQLPEPIIYIDA